MSQPAPGTPIPLPSDLVKCLQAVLDLARAKVAASHHETPVDQDLDEFLAELGGPLDPRVARHFLLKLLLLVQLPAGNWRVKPSLPVNAQVVAALIDRGDVPFEEAVSPAATPLAKDERTELLRLRSENRELRLRLRKLERAVSILQTAVAGLVRAFLGGE